MRKVLVLAAVAFQVLALGYMAGEREYIVKTGRSVFLRTAPVDPRDIFRGDYVALRYEISTIDKHQLRDRLTGNLTWDMRQLPVYVALEEHDGVARVRYASDREPDGGLFIAGRLEWFNPTAIGVAYGIESLYVEQGEGIKLESLLPARGATTTLEMEVKLGRGGQGILVGYRAVNQSQP